MYKILNSFLKFPLALSLRKLFFFPRRQQSSVTQKQKYGSCSVKYIMKQLKLNKLSNFKEKFFAISVQSTNKYPFLFHLQPLVNFKFVWDYASRNSKKIKLQNNLKPDYAKKFLYIISKVLNSNFKNILQNNQTLPDYFTKIGFPFTRICLQIYSGFSYRGLVATSKSLRQFWIQSHNLINHLVTQEQRRHFNRLFQDAFITSASKLDTIIDSSTESLLEDNQVRSLINNFMIYIQKKDKTDSQLVLKKLVTMSVRRIKENFIKEPELKFNTKILSLVIKNSIREELEAYNTDSKN